MATGTCGFQHIHQETGKEDEWCGGRLRDTVALAGFDPTDRNTSPRGHSLWHLDGPSVGLMKSGGCVQACSVRFIPLLLFPKWPCLWSDKLTGISILLSSSIPVTDRVCSASLSFVPRLCPCRVLLMASSFSYCPFLLWKRSLAWCPQRSRHSLSLELYRVLFWLRDPLGLTVVL